MYLKVVTSSDQLATAVVETAIKCGGDPTDIKRHRIAGTDSHTFSVYLKGPRSKLNECRLAIVKTKYYMPANFSFQFATTMALFAEAEEE